MASEKLLIIMKLSDAKCLILCGGEGIFDTTAREYLPKCMIKIGGKPLIHHLIVYASQFGISNFVLATGKYENHIKSYFINKEYYDNDIQISFANQSITPSQNANSLKNLNIQIVSTGEDCQTGGRIARVKRFFQKEEYFLMLYSDILSSLDLNDLLSIHLKENRTITCIGVNPTSRFGIFNLSKSKITNYSIGERSNLNQSRLNGGIFICSSSIFDFLEPINECNLEVEVLKQLQSQQQISLLRHDGFWHYIDTERDIKYLNELFWKNERPWLLEKKL